MTLKQPSWANCWATDRCKDLKAQGEAACNEYCTAHLLLKALFDKSGMPKGLQRARIKNLGTNFDDPPSYHEAVDWLSRYTEQVADLVPAGQGLYIYARSTPQNPMGTGTGKTTAAAALMNEWFFKTAYTANLEPMGAWVVVPEWLDALKNSFNGGELPNHLSFERLSTVPLLVLDDLGSEKPSEWASERIYTVVNRRVGEGLATIVTSNFTITELAERVGYRVASRLETLQRIDLTSFDHRRGGMWTGPA